MQDRANELRRIPLPRTRVNRASEMMRRYAPDVIMGNETDRKEETMAQVTRPTAEEVKAMLGLEPHPTCGFVAETYRSPLKIPADALPKVYEGNRPYGSALYFLVDPDAQIVMHRIRSDQLYHHYFGDPLEVLMLYPDGTGAVEVVGDDLAAGERPQLFVPGDTFHTSRLASGGTGYALLASTEWPGVEPPDVEHGDIEELVAAYPDFREQIRRFTG